MQEQQLITIEHSLTINTIPSGSGMAVVKNSVFIIGDDSPWLFELSADLKEVNRFLMVKGFQEEGRIPKAIKSDFECLAEYKSGEDHFLLVFGSGAKSPERDVLVRVNVARPESPEVFSLIPFYDYLLKEKELSRADLNMEAAVAFEKNLYLFNRGTNSIFVLNLEVFLAYVEGRQEAILPEFQDYPFKLPETEGVSAGFSGACGLPGSSKILFTATLEATENWIADGEILGSYLGVLDLNRLAEGEIENITLVSEKSGKAIKEKLESVSVLERHQDRSLTVLAVADNDDGTSRLLSIRLEKEFFSGND